MYLYRPVNKAELLLIEALDYKAFPPRLDFQPIFYPVCNLEYASYIALEWNVPAYGEGFVTGFEIDEDYISNYSTHIVGDIWAEEYWTLSEDLEEFNSHIIGKIEVIESYGKM